MKEGPPGPRGTSSHCTRTSPGSRRSTRASSQSSSSASPQTWALRHTQRLASCGVRTQGLAPCAQHLHIPLACNMASWLSTDSSNPTCNPKQRCLRQTLLHSGWATSCPALQFEAPAKAVGTASLSCFMMPKQCHSVTIFGSNHFQHLFMMSASPFMA